MIGRRFWEIGGFVAGAVLILFGAVAIYMGVDGRSTVRDALKQEQITFGDGRRSRRCEVRRAVGR